MKALYCGALAVVVAIAGFTQDQSAQKQARGHDTAREKLIGAWQLAHIEAPGPDGKPVDIPQPKGMLIYTRVMAICQCSSCTPDQQMLNPTSTSKWVRGFLRELRHG